MIVAHNTQKIIYKGLKQKLNCWLWIIDFHFHPTCNQQWPPMKAYRLNIMHDIYVRQVMKNLYIMYKNKWMTKLLNFLATATYFTHDINIPHNIFWHCRHSPDLIHKCHLPNFSYTPIQYDFVLDKYYIYVLPMFCKIQFIHRENF